ncbi:MAG: outer membrane beta-barrel protein [Bacteroidota bacterium]
MEKNFIDDLARKAFENMEVPYQPEDWDLMEARLNKERKLQGQLLFFKGVEVALVLFALWTVFQFLPANFPSSTSPSNAEEPAMIIPADVERAEIQPTENILDESKETVAPGTNTTNPLNANAQSGKPVADGTLNNDIYQPSSKYNGKEDVAVNDENSADPLPPDLTLQPDDMNETINQNEIAYNKTTTLENLNETNSSIPTVESSLARTALSTVMLPARAPFTLEDNFEWAFFPIGGDPIPDRVRRPKRLSVIFSPDMNGMENNLAMGFSVGILAAKELTDNWDIETGLAYSYKPFDYLASDEEGNPIMEDAVQDVQLHLAEVPVMMQYSFNKSVNWRSYATFGVSTFLIAHADYNKKNIELPIVVEDNSDKGLLQGGRFMPNFYLTANLGFGLERKLSKNTSLFVQPTFRYPLMKMGPYEDKLGTFSLAMGARTTL